MLHRSIMLLPTSLILVLAFFASPARAALTCANMDLPSMGDGLDTVGIRAL
jgi:hypothetical protein